VTVQDENGVAEEDIKEDGPGQVTVNQLWDAYLSGDHGASPDFEHALTIQKVTDAVWKSNAEGRTVML
jgi:predicted dehydrogenase